MQKENTTDTGGNFDQPIVSSSNLNLLQKALIRDGYAKKDDWYIDSGVIEIKFNKRTITLRSKKGTQKVFADPNKITLEEFSRIIHTSMV